MPCHHCALRVSTTRERYETGGELEIERWREIERIRSREDNEIKVADRRDKVGLVGSGVFFYFFIFYHLILIDLNCFKQAIKAHTMILLILDH